MGEEKKPEEDKPKEEEPKTNEEPKKESEAPAAEAAPPPPPPPPPEEVEMRVFMHCEGCARKVRRSLKGFDGVEEVRTDCRTHKVVVKGKKAAQDPLKVVERVQKKTGRKVELLSPLPPPPPPQEKKEEEKPKAEVKKEEPVVIAVVLKVHMHCEACAQEIKKRILRMEGVQLAESDLEASHVTVKGVFDPQKLIGYIHKRTSKHATIIKAEPINKKPEDEKAKEEEKGKDEKKEGNKAEGGDNKATKEEEKKTDEKKVDDKAEGDKAEKEGKNDTNKAEKEGKNDAKDEKEKKELSPEEMAVAAAAAAVVAAAAKMEQKRNEFYYYYPTVPRYPMEYVAAYSAYPQHQYQMAYAPTQSLPQPQGAYAPQIFSDENPNACSVM